MITLFISHKPKCDFIAKTKAECKKKANVESKRAKVKKKKEQIVDYGTITDQESSGDAVQITSVRPKSSARIRKKGGIKLNQEYDGPKGKK